MRILHVIATLNPADGGPPESVRLLVKGYNPVGTRVEVVCLDDPREEFLRDIPCKVHALGQRFLGRYAFSLRLWNWLRKHASQYDGIVMNGIWTFPGVALRHAARRAGTPYGIFTHGALDPWFNRQYPLKHVKKLLYWPLQRRVLGDAKAVFFTTAAERDLAETSFRPSRWTSVVVPYGITDPEHHTASPHQEVAAFFRKAPALRGRRYLLFLARIHEKKGCDLLLEAFANFAMTAPDLDLVIAGPDQTGLQTKLVQQSAELGIAERVHWPGMIGGETKWGALRACEALVLPSHQENFGICVAEALAVGRPVLISNRVNIWVEIAEAGAGLVEEDTLIGTVTLLRRWLAMSSAERAAMARRARPCFLANFTMDRAASAISQLFIAYREQKSAAYG